MDSSCFNFQIDYLPAAQVVRVVTFGRFHFASNQKVVTASLEAAKQHQTCRFLIDHRQAEIVLRDEDIPLASKVNFILGLRPNFRRAYLYNPDCPSHAVIQHYVELSAALGLQSKVFVDEVVAMAWLSSNQPAISAA